MSRVTFEEFGIGRLASCDFHETRIVLRPEPVVLEDTVDVDKVVLVRVDQLFLLGAREGREGASGQDQ